MIRKHINKYKLRQKLPGFLTFTACAGVIATGILSAKAMYDYIRDNDADDGEIDVERAVKVSILPAAVGAGTIASFIFARKIDKATIAALSTATASVINQSQTSIKKQAAKKFKTPDNCCVVDEDGELYFEPITGLLIKASPLHIKEGMYKLNRNYQLRGGLASLYEFFRLIGVKKKDIRDKDTMWSEYIGWTAEMSKCDLDVCWIDIYTDKTNDGNIIAFHINPMPICYDVPRFVMDICHCDEEDLQELYLDRAENVTDQICREIGDDYAD